MADTTVARVITARGVSRHAALPSRKKCQQRYRPFPPSPTSLVRLYQEVGEVFATYQSKTRCWREWGTPRFRMGKP